MSAGIIFPPERKQPKQGFSGIITLQMSVLTKHQELLNMALQVQKLHNAAESEDKKLELQQLENDADMYVQGAQTTKKTLESVKAEHFAATARYEQAKEVLRSASNNLELFQSELEDGEPDALLTRKQERERASKLEQFIERAEVAGVEETAALSDLNRIIQKMNEASRAYAAWVYIAQQLKGELKAGEQQA